MAKIAERVSATPEVPFVCGKRDRLTKPSVAISASLKSAASPTASGRDAQKAEIAAAHQA
jgi:hypothetical protein